MMRLLQIEIYKIFKRQRTYIAFAVIAAIIFLIQIGLKFGGYEYVGMIMGAMNGVFEVPAEEMLNGYFVCYFILNLLLVHVPILVALIAGDMISGESNMGTLRLLASKAGQPDEIITRKVRRFCFLHLCFIGLGGHSFFIGKHGDLWNEFIVCAKRTGSEYYSAVRCFVEIFCRLWICSDRNDHHCGHGFNVLRICR